MNTKILAVFIAATILATALVIAPQPVKVNTVHGFVYCKDPTGKGWHVEGANVQVDCGVATEYNISQNGGQYDVDFLDTVCPKDSVVDVYAEKDGNTGNATGIMGNNNANIDVEMTEIVVDMGKCTADTVNPPIPEFSAIAAASALIGSALGFVALRRKK